MHLAILRKPTYLAGLLAFGFVLSGLATPAQAATLDLTLNVAISPAGDVTVFGEVTNGNGPLPANVVISGLWSGNAQVLASGYYEDERNFGPGTAGYVIVTATVGNETVTKSQYVQVGGGGPGGL